MMGRSYPIELRKTRKGPTGTKLRKYDKARKGLKGLKLRITRSVANRAEALIYEKCDSPRSGARASCLRTSIDQSISVSRAYCLLRIRNHIENDDARASRISRRGQIALAPGNANHTGPKSVPVLDDWTSRPSFTLGDFT